METSGSGNSIYIANTNANPLYMCSRLCFTMLTGDEIEYQHIKVQIAFMFPRFLERMRTGQTQQ